MRNGPAAAAAVETTAAAGDKKRRENTPGVVLKVAVAMMCVLVSGHRGQAGLGSLPLPGSAALRVRRLG